MGGSQRWRRVAALGAVSALALAAGAAGVGPEGWQRVGVGVPASASSLNAAVNALSTDAAGTLLVGGAFQNAGGVASADYVAKWDGSRWQALGAQTLNGAVNAIAARGGKVYVGGLFRDAGGNASADYVAVWDGQRWGPACTGPPIGDPVYALAIVGSTLYVGGTFRGGAGIASADFLVACDLTTGAPRSAVGTGTAITGGGVSALTADSRGRLYAGGGFLQVAGVATPNKVAYLDGGGWHSLGPGTAQPGRLVRSLAASGTDVYVGTDALDIGGIPLADHVAKWDGSAWSALGSNTAGNDGWFPQTAFIYSLTAVGSRVFAGGDWPQANGDPRAARIAEFDGSAWHALAESGAAGGPFNGNVNALATFSQRLYAGGSFSSAGGDPLARGLASRPLAALPSGGGGGAGGGGAAGPATGTATGTVLVNGSPFTGGTVAYGASVDVTRGRLVMRTEAGPLTVYGGGVTSKFKLVRASANKKRLVELRLTGGDFSACRKVSSARGQAKTKTVRRLWSNGKGVFRTQARYSSASVQGTVWLTEDRCDGTFTSVKQGVVTVRDRAKKKTVTLRAGQSYLAKPR
jgi:hypothetical protein